MEITWDLGLQEKSQQLLESYKGRCCAGGRRHTSAVPGPHSPACSSYPARKAEADMTLGEKYARERKMKKRLKKKAVRVSACGAAACRSGSPVAHFCSHARSCCLRRPRRAPRKATTRTTWRTGPTIPLSDRPCWRSLA